MDSVGWRKRGRVAGDVERIDWGREEMGSEEVKGSKWCVYSSLWRPPPSCVCVWVCKEVKGIVNFKHAHTHIIIYILHENFPVAIYIYHVCAASLRVRLWYVESIRGPNPIALALRWRWWLRMAVFYSQPLPSPSSLDDTLLCCCCCYCGCIAARSRSTPPRDGERYWISHWLTVIYKHTHTHAHCGDPAGFFFDWSFSGCI